MEGGDELVLRFFRSGKLFSERVCKSRVTARAYFRYHSMSANYYTQLVVNGEVQKTAQAERYLGI